MRCKGKSNPNSSGITIKLFSNHKIDTAPQIEFGIVIDIAVEFDIAIEIPIFSHLNFIKTKQKQWI